MSKRTVAVVEMPSREVLADLPYHATLPTWVQEKLESGEVALMVEEQDGWRMLTTVDVPPIR